MAKKYLCKKETNLSPSKNSRKWRKNSRKWRKIKMKQQKAKRTSKKKETIKSVDKICSSHYKSTYLKRKAYKKAKKVNFQWMRLTNSL